MLFPLPTLYLPLRNLTKQLSNGTYMTVKLSCVICVYNEAARIRKVLDVVVGHPALDEIIVVNDGSTDEAGEILSSYPAVHLVSYMPNRGKTYALSRGIREARNERIMLIDADLAGLTPENIAALIEPVATGKADVSISLRRNSLAFYRLIGIDFVSGERVIPRSLLQDALPEMERLPCWGGEVFMNRLIIARNLRVAVVRWQNVFNVRKFRKVGFWRGIFEELDMILDALKVVSPLEAFRQNVALLALMKHRPAVAAKPTRGRLAASSEGV